ncbi:MAG: hypothetical protein KDJ89_08210, partial [Notoacmeibacter sp.]|nr:hypothetical protein [Notoacmeibacter sp.]
KRNCLEKRVRHCLLNRSPSREELQGKSRTCRPRFSFFNIRLSKSKAASSFQHQPDHIGNPASKSNQTPNQAHLGNSRAQRSVASSAAALVVSGI